ncbi:right-handed parallel beta-helix repeat-containing protein [Methylomonas sp. MK1]|uniref:right-handed parallel beta-helix repeat-containing protein n=1 Tax=Methylomonas sp. MK1 TaxID=1131552 RepID=UPI000374BBE6|nr:right-handed parallel beta-helix repeat-containing protein [Methylomonas sp. MK1]
MSLNKFTLLAIIFFSTNAIAHNFYISPSGNDSSDGLSGVKTETSGPFQTLARAQKAIRDLKTNKLFKESVTVHILSGTYQLHKAMEFDIRDSGNAEKIVRWQGENGPVIISGGISLQNCGHIEDKLWTCPTLDLPLDKIKYPQNYRKRGNVPGFELFINQEPMHLARWPNSDWAHIKLPVDERTSFTSIEPMPSLESDLSNAQVHIMAGNDWHDQYIAVLNIVRDENKIILASNTNYPLTSGRRYYLQNIQSELDAPGEWFYDKSNNRILFIAPDSNQPKTIEASSLQNLFTFMGSKFISFNNLTFQYSTDVAISLDKTSHIEFNEIKVINIGGKAIEVKYSDNFRFLNSFIHNTGEGGIVISGGNRNSLTAANNLIHNNHINDFGRIVMTYTPAVEASGVGTHITHNLIERSPGTGILLFGNDHLVEKNEIHHVCEQASDCGAIYSGRDWTYRGNIIRYNSIHDLSGYGLKSVDIVNNKVTYIKPDGVRGVYLDDLVSGFSVVGNIFNNAGVMAVQIGGGRDNIIENNIITTNNYAIWVDNRIPSIALKKGFLEVPTNSRTWLNKYPKLGQPVSNENWPEGNSLQRNIMISNKPDALLLRYTLPANSNTIAHNLIWSVTGSVILNYNILDKSKKRDNASWQEWIAEGVEQNSIFADPCVTFVGNIANICSESPINKIGFKPLPSDIGLIR